MKSMPNLDRILHFLDRKVGDEMKSYRLEFISFREWDSIFDKPVRLHNFLERIETFDVKHYLDGELELSQEMSRTEAQNYFSNETEGGWMKNNCLGGHDRQFFWYRAGELRFRIDTAGYPKYSRNRSERLVFSGNIEAPGREEAEEALEYLLYNNHDENYPY